MNNLMTSTFDFNALKSRYNLFATPSIRIKINNKLLKLPEDLVIANLEVELTCGFEANIASFSVYGVVDEELRKFKNSIQGLFDLGSRVDIEVGYEEEKTNVFTGFISSATYKLPQQGAGSLNINCMDVKGVMMNNNSYAQREYKKSSDMVENLLRQSQYSGFYSDLAVRATSEEVAFIETTNESDFEFVARLARKIDYEFFVSQDTVIFRPSRSQNAPVGVLAFGGGVEGIEINYNILGRYGSVEVRNTNNGTGELVSGIAKSTALYSNSSSAAKVLKAASKVVLDTTVYSQAEAQKRAQAQLEENGWGFGDARLQCVGIPDLTPGRFVMVKGIYGDLDKKFYITGLKHVLARSKFTTYLYAGLNSL